MTRHHDLSRSRHALARGVDPNACMAELFGKITGCSRGKGGSMHFFDAKNIFTAVTASSRADSARHRAGYAQKYLGTTGDPAYMATARSTRARSTSR